MKRRSRSEEPYPAGEEPYLTLVRQLRERIAEVGPGGRLPSIGEIHRDTGRWPATIRRAYDVLIEEGLVVSQPKVGFFVRRYPALRYRMARTHDPAHLLDLPTVDGWIADVQEAGYLGQEEIITDSVLGRSKLDVYTIGELLGIGANDVAVVRARIRRIAMDPEQPQFLPESLADTYYPLALVEGTPIMEPGDVNTAKILTEAGHPQVDFDHEMIARLPEPEESRRLQLPRGTAVMERITVARDHHDRPVYVQHVITVGNGSRFVFKMRYQKGT